MIEQVLKYLKITDSYQMPKRLMKQILDTDKREDFLNSLEYTDVDLDKDSFFHYFQEEHAERKKLKQDFTPPQVSRILNEIALENSNYIYEPTAGTGGVLVEHWSNNKNRKDEIFYVAEEISPRALPMLLFNMILRGMNGVVIQGNSITREAEAVFLLNGQGNQYSDIKVMPYSKDVEKEFDIHFIAKPYLEYTEWHTRVYNLWENLLEKKIEITPITLDKLKEYDIITVTDRTQLLGIVHNPSEIRGEILEIHELKSDGKIARVTIKKEG